MNPDPVRDASSHTPTVSIPVSHRFFVKWGVRLAILAGFAAAWQLLALNARSLMVPTFTSTVKSLLELLGDAGWWSALMVSNQAMLAGYLAGVAAGTCLGLAMGRWRMVDEILDPYLSILLVTPMAAAIPVLIMLMGLGLASRVAVVLFYCLPAIVVNARAGMRMLEPGWVEMARAFGGTEGQIWSKVVMRGASPAILEGWRLGLIRAVTGMVATELLLVAVGIGRLLIDYQSRFEAGHLCASVVLIIAEAVLLARLGERAAAWLFPWTGRTVLE